MSSATASTASSSTRPTPASWPTDSPSSHATPCAGPRWARPAVRASSSATPWPAWSTTSTVCTGTCSRSAGCLAPRDLDEGVPGGLLLAGDGLQAGLPAAEVWLVLDQEPQEHVDARVLPRHRVDLRQVRRLLRPAHAEGRVGRIRLVAVLGDPEMLRAVQLRDLGEQHVDVPHLDAARVLARRHERRRLVRRCVVRMMRVHVELLHPRL